MLPSSSLNAIQVPPAAPNTEARDEENAAGNPTLPPAPANYEDRELDDVDSEEGLMNLVP